MGQDTGQFDISDRQLMAGNSRIKASEWTEIGQAEVVYTIFGKAKVRIVRKNDRMRNALYLLVIAAVAAIAWEGWVLFERTETEQSETFLPRLNTKNDVNEPVSK